MSNEQPKPVPRKPRIRTKSEHDSQSPDVQGGLEQSFKQMDIGSNNDKSEIERLSEKIMKLKQEEHTLREAVSQLQLRRDTLMEQIKLSEATMKKKEIELVKREAEFSLSQEKFRCDVSDKEYTLRNREFELQRLEDELNARKKEMALAKFDEGQEGVSSAELAKLADKEMQLQKQEEHLHKREIDLNNWAMDLDQQAKDIQRRLIEVEQREANAHVTSQPLPQPHPQWGGEPPPLPQPHPQWGGEPPPLPQPHPQWGGEPPRPQIYTSPIPTGDVYHHQSGHQWYSPDSPSPARPTQYPPYTANQGAGILGPNPGIGLLGPNPTSSQGAGGAGLLGPNPGAASGYHLSHQQQQQQQRQHMFPQQQQMLNQQQQMPTQQQMLNQQFQGQQVYQQQTHSPLSSSGIDHTMSSQTNVPGRPSPGSSSSSSSVTQGHPGSYAVAGMAPSLNVPRVDGRSQSSDSVVFSVGAGAGSESNLRASSNSVASALSSDDYLPGRLEGGAAPKASGYHKTIDEYEERARALQWEELEKAKQQEDADLELARKLQEQYDAEVRSTQKCADSTDQLLALQLQHEDLKEGYGSGLTHDNQLLDEGEGAEVTDVVKKVLDERMTRQHQIRQQEEVDRRIAQNISASDHGDTTEQANLQNNLSS